MPSVIAFSVVEEGAVGGEGAVAVEVAVGGRVEAGDLAALGAVDDDGEGAGAAGKAAASGRSGWAAAAWPRSGSGRRKVSVPSSVRPRSQ